MMQKQNNHVALLIFLCYKSNFTNPTMHLSDGPQCTIQKRNMHISVLNGVLRHMGQVHCGICEIGLLTSRGLFYMD